MNTIKLLKNDSLQSVLNKLIDQLEEWVVVYNEQGEIQYINTYAQELSGFKEDEVIGKDSRALWNINGYNNMLYPQIELAAKNGEKFDTVMINTTKEGNIFYLSAKIRAAVNDENNLIYYVCMGKDITNTKKLEEKLHKINYYDEVTGLPNQNAFLQFVYKNACKKQVKPFAVILVDISQMSYINNTYGLNAGDIVLREIGSRINKFLRDRYMIAKLNADVFGILLTEIENENQCTQVLKEIFKQVDKPIEIQMTSVYVAIKAGIAIYPQDADSAGEIINKAQIALAKAKAEPKSIHYEFYTKAIQKEVQDRMLLENDMHKAIENKEFIVYYQPFVNLATQELTGLEALLRRKKGNGEIVGPSTFISLLEEMQLIEQVGIMVIQKVCKQMREWIEAGYTIVPVSVNLSAIQFKNRYLAKDIYEVLCEYDIDPRWMTLEITETVVMKDIEIAQETLRELKRYGFSIAIDDFGTGYSSLNYLKNFIFDDLKIDISFIKEIAKSPQDKAIVAAIISMAKALSLGTIAEGIETQDQFELIHEMGCEMGQGYLWDAAMPAVDLSKKYLNKKSNH